MEDPASRTSRARRRRRTQYADRLHGRPVAARCSLTIWFLLGPAPAAAAQRLGPRPCGPQPLPASRRLAPVGEAIEHEEEAGGSPKVRGQTPLRRWSRPLLGQPIPSPSGGSRACRDISYWPSRSVRNETAGRPSRFIRLCRISQTPRPDRTAITRAEGAARHQGPRALLRASGPPAGRSARAPEA